MEDILKEITALQVFIATAAATVGFLFRIGADWTKNGEKLPRWENIIITLFFSCGLSSVVFYLSIMLGWKEVYQVLMTLLGSFFGKVFIQGISAISPEFFREIGEDFLRKWADNLASKNKLNNYNKYDDDEETEETDMEDTKQLNSREDNAPME